MRVPAIREVYFTHPQTGGPGLWFDLTTGPGFVGLAQTAISALVPGGNPATRLQRFQDALNAALQALCEVRIPMASIPADDPIKLVGPEVGCRIDGADYVIRIVGVSIPVVSLGPPIVLGAIMISEAASRSTYV